QTDLNFSLSAPLLNERVQITFGGTFDVPIQSDIEQNIRLFPDVNVELLLNETGSLRATFFYSQASDLLFGATQTGRRSQRAGAKLSYRKDFESLSELFGAKHGEKKTDTIPPATDTIPDAPKPEDD
ncbi:MAG: hypothetical protein M3413_06410, partial [Bacteroidota bacterium]|nr:hypothetical protein [Bacteroidota bacterium]